MSNSVDVPQLPSVDGPLQVRYLPLSKLARAPRTPKGHALDVIDNSISRFGFINPIVVNEKTGRIVAGHGRLDTLQRAKAAGKRPPDRIVEKDGEWYAPVLVGVAFATDAEAEAFSDRGQPDGRAGRLRREDTCRNPLRPCRYAKRLNRHGVQHRRRRKPAAQGGRRRRSKRHEPVR